MDDSLTPHAPFAREIHETGDLFVADATRRSDIDIAFQPVVMKLKQHLPQMLNVWLGGCQLLAMEFGLSNALLMQKRSAIVTLENV